MSWNVENGKLAVERMLTRASCRVFDDTPIADETLQQILKAGIRAASGGNLQPYSIIVVKDAEKRQQLADLCGGQQFMAKAPVNLIFLLDWYKMGRLAKLERAPFTADHSYMHYLIGLEDTICTAQSIETAAWELGVGSVYIGTVNGVARELAEIYNLPQYTYPVVILSMGYPKNELNLRERLPYEMTVFEERYPDFSDEQIKQGFAAKYDGRMRNLPTADSAREEWLERFRAALVSTYAPEEVEAIIKEVEERGTLHHTQYVFGLHYHAAEMLEHGKEVMQMLKEQGLEPFYMLDK